MFAFVVDEYQLFGMYITVQHSHVSAVGRFSQNLCLFAPVFVFACCALRCADQLEQAKNELKAKNNVVRSACLRVA